MREGEIYLGQLPVIALKDILLLLTAELKELQYEVSCGTSTVSLFKASNKPNP